MKLTNLIIIKLKSRFIQRLLFVHGHKVYYNLSVTMSTFYFKCIILVVPQLLLQFYSGFSANSSIETVLFSIYNLTMTGLLSMIFGMFETHMEDNVLLSKPYLYNTVNIFNYRYYLFIYLSKLGH